MVDEVEVVGVVVAEVDGLWGVLDGEGNVLLGVRG
jgi:hypothetical protein